jgi:hypothetical protein
VVRPTVPIPAPNGPGGTVVQLPQQIHLVATSGSTWAGRAIRFNHLGQACATGTSGCTPDPNNGSPPVTPYINTSPAGAYVGSYTICLRQDNSPLRAIVVIQPGGIARVVQASTNPCP